MPVNPSDEEERYFHEREQEKRQALREKFDSNAKELAEHEQIASDVNTDDLAIAAKIKALGFFGDTAKIFQLLPLVHVAWADGKIQRGERAAILKLLEGRGIEPGSEAFQSMESLLEERPSEEFMRQSLDVLRAITHGVGDREREILDLCIDVAAASGGILGLGQRISDDERKAIEDVLKDFDHNAAEHVKDEMSK
jgi:hypothetical protein